MTFACSGRLEGRPLQTMPLHFLNKKLEKYLVPINIIPIFAKET